MILRLKPSLCELLDNIIGVSGSFAPKLDVTIQNPKFEAWFKPDFTQ